MWFSLKTQVPMSQDHRRFWKSSIILWKISFQVLQESISYGSGAKKIPTQIPYDAICQFLIPCSGTHVITRGTSDKRLLRTHCSEERGNYHFDSNDRDKTDPTGGPRSRADQELIVKYVESYSSLSSEWEMRQKSRTGEDASCECNTSRKTIILGVWLTACIRDVLGQEVMWFLWSSVHIVLYVEWLCSS